MDDQAFDQLARALSSPASRRVILATVAGLALRGPVHAAGAAASAGPRTRRSAKVTICHRGHDLSVAPEAVAAHLRHGDRVGSCSEEPGPQTCSGATLACSTTPSPCGPTVGCDCLTTTTGGSFCASAIQCEASRVTCLVDTDCPAGMACVPTFGCTTCNAGSNACASPCNPIPPGATGRKASGRRRQG